MAKGIWTSNDAAKGSDGSLQLGAMGDKSNFGEAKEDENEDRCGVFLGFKPGVGAELIGGVPDAFCVGSVVGVHFGWVDPVHSFGRTVLG